MGWIRANYATLLNTYGANSCTEGQADLSSSQMKTLLLALSLSLSTTSLWASVDCLSTAQEAAKTTIENMAKEVNSSGHIEKMELRHESERTKVYQTLGKIYWSLYLVTVVTNASCEIEDVGIIDLH
jgi:hypothetical protein